MAIRKSPVLPIITAILTLILLTAFTVFSIGIVTDEVDDKDPDSLSENSQQQQQSDVVPKEIHYFESLEWIHSMESRGQDFYIVVFDVGTTGTRAHVFHFGKSNHGDIPILLSDDVFESPIPLTNSLAEPNKAAEHCLSGLVDHVISAVPESLIASTQVLLKATENLRQLTEDDRHRLIKAAYDYLNEASPLLVNSYEDTFGVLDSQKEGLYQWITINYIKGILSPADDITSSTSGVIGFGGGSVQIAFEPTQSATMQYGAILRDDLVDVHIFPHSKKVYTHSYSGLGRAASRLEILQTEAKIRNNLLQSSSEMTAAVADILGNTHQGNDILQSSNILYSVCLPPGYTGVLIYDDVINDVASSTLSRPHSVFDVCTAIATVFLDLAETGPIKKFPEVNTDEFYVLEKSLRHSVGMSDDADGSISLGDITRAAKQVCNRPALAEPFACIDLVYTNVLLERGFGFQSDTVIHIDMPARLDGALSWALGFVVDWLQNHSSS